MADDLDVTATTPGVSEQELDATAIVEPDRHLTLEVLYREVKEDDRYGQVVKTQKFRFPVKGRIPIPTMTAFYRLETRINEALAAPEDDQEALKELERTLSEAHDRIVGLVSERTPEVFAETEIGGVKVKPGVELELNQVLGVLSWLSGDTSIADALAKALTAGQSGALSAEEIAARAEEAAADGEPGARPVDAAPLA